MGKRTKVIATGLFKNYGYEKGLEKAGVYTSWSNWGGVKVGISRNG